MNEALELIQKKLTEYAALYDKADARVRAAQEQKQLAEQERLVYNDSIDELNRALKTLQKVNDQDRKARDKAEEELEFPPTAAKQ